MVISSRTLSRASMNTLLEDEMEMEAAKVNIKSVRIQIPQTENISIFPPYFFKCVKSSKKEKNQPGMEEVIKN